MSEAIQVLLVDDHTLVRQGIAALVSRQADIEIVGECGNGLEVVRRVLEAEPDVVVLDITLPGLNGLDVCRQITRKSKNSAVLILTMHADEEHVVRAFKSGATGYLLKEAAAEQFTEAVRAVASGELYLGAGIPSTVLKRLGEEGEEDSYSLLTDRERQVLQQIAEGLTNRQVAENLGVSTKTVDTHRTRLMRKLGIHNQTMLVKYAYQRGIVKLD